MDKLKFEDRVRTGSFVLLKHIARLSSGLDGWNKEVNVVHWNNSKAGPMIDIRWWSPTHKQMSRGVTLTIEDAVNLKEALEQFLNTHTDLDVFREGEVTCLADQKQLK